MDLVSEVSPRSSVAGSPRGDAQASLASGGDGIADEQVPPSPARSDRGGRGPPPSAAAQDEVDRRQDEQVQALQAQVQALAAVAGAGSGQLSARQSRAELIAQARAAGTRKAGTLTQRNMYL